MTTPEPTVPPDPQRNLAGWLDRNYRRQVKRVADEVRRAADRFEDNAVPNRNAVDPTKPLGYVGAAAFGVGQLHQAVATVPIGALFDWARDAEIMPLTERSDG